jgi:hypothetical protein
MPIAIWIALNNQKSKSLIWWCVGGELFAISLLLVGLRPVLPTWLSYTVANGLSWFAIWMQATSLLLGFKAASTFKSNHCHGHFGLVGGV